jgi:hypothetical protein
LKIVGGLPRSGTSIIHNILSKSPRFIKASFCRHPLLVDEDVWHDGTQFVDDGDGLEGEDGASLYELRRCLICGTGWDRAGLLLSLRERILERLDRGE